MIMKLRLQENGKTSLLVLLCIVFLHVSMFVNSQESPGLLGNDLAFSGKPASLADQPFHVVNPPAFVRNAPMAINVTGQVKDDDGQPMAGATVQVKGTTSGTVTDADGRYKVSVPDADAILVFSFVGYITEEVAVGGQTVIDITLSANVAELGEVVVVGYGSVKKSDLTGSISSIKPAELTQLPTQRVDQALQGRTTGVFILNTDGSPGGNTMIRIRGNNSINGGNDPLIIVDGLQGANINQLNPNDIASMEILKDASATAIYGSRGANGVILITTKLGKIGKPVIDAGYNVGFQNLARKLPVMDAYTFAKYNNLVQSRNTGQGNIPHYYFDTDPVYYKTHSTDWQDEIYKTGVLQNANLAISGATEKLKYMVSTSYLDHQGILINSAYSRLSLRANLTADITKWVDFGLNYSYTSEKYKSPPFNSEQGDVLFQPVNDAPRWAPTEPVYDENGNYWRHRPGYGAPDTWNPVATALETKIENPTYQNNVNLFLNFKPMKGLSLKIMGGGTFSNSYNSKYENTKTRNGYAMNGVGTIYNAFDNRFQNTNILTYDNTFGPHHITVTGVLEDIMSSSVGSSMTGQDFLVDQLNFDNMDGAKSVSVDSWRSKRALLSYMGRLNYGLYDKYLFTFSYRADGSSVFGKNNKWGFFPSGSLAWRVSQENFLKDVSLISDLKLRASYGVTGNQGINPYGSLATLGSGSDWNYPYSNGNNLDIGFGISDIANPSLKWETTSQTDLGVDVSLFKGRLTSTIDVYKKVTDDLLMPRQLPGYVGVNSVLDNIGSIENKGLEILVGGDPLVGRVRWNTSFNITMNRNKVLDLGPGVDRIGYRPTSGGYNLGDDYMFLEVGQPFGLMKGWKYVGLWRSDQDAEARSYGQLPGLEHLADLSGPDGIPDGKVDTYDKTTIGNGYPKFTWGFTNLFTFKGIELSFLIIGSHGNDLFNTLRIRRETYEANDPKVLNYWTSPEAPDLSGANGSDNQNTDVEALYDGKWVEDQHLVNKYFTSGYQTTSRWVENASFIRVKTITLAYSFEQGLLKKVGFTKARVYFSGTNLITFTKYTGYDPEIAAYPGNDATIGVDMSVYPTAKMYTFGVDFTF
jgi:TonB-dependent starch-binding outer membrane protein SusC